MIRRIIEIALFVALLIGAYQAWSTGLERSRLEAEFKRLVKATGDFTISDPTKVHILAIPTGEPHDFAWRIYLPPKYDLVFWRNSMWQGSNMGTNQGETIGLMRFHEEEGVLNEFDNIGMKRSLEPVGDEKLAEFLRGRWSQLQVEQAGANGIITIDPKDSVLLLRLRMPREMEAEARKLISSSGNLEFIPELFSYGFGPSPPG